MRMHPTVAPLRNPVRVDEDGRLLIGDTRISLDVIAYCFRDGDSPEEIQRAYPSLSLDQIYGALAYYLQNRDDVEAYIRRREQDGDELRRRIEAETDSLAFQRRVLEQAGRPPTAPDGRPEPQG